MDPPDSPIIIQHHPGLRVLVLNRPRVINTLNLEMIRLLRAGLEEARADDRVRLVLLAGAGEKGFCAGGDLKELAQAVREGAIDRAQQFFREEYTLDLMIHEFSKPVAALADGVTMGGGLGLAAGADTVIATGRTRMAMPETRIGFFPDVGATGWLFHKCPPGYPEYLALTGYELAGGECVRVGLATHLAPSARLPELNERLKALTPQLSPEKPAARRQIRAELEAFTENEIPANPELDAWVAEHFAGMRTLGEILASLNRCSLELKLCEDVHRRLAERSPTALAVTLGLLRANEGRPLPEVFHREGLAARFMVQHPDYLEGIRARIIDKDDKPRWQPESLEEVAGLEMRF